MASESASSRVVFAARDARYSIVCLVVSVLPAPDSPDMTIDWLAPWRCIVAYARSATEYTCGGAGLLAGRFEYSGILSTP